MKVGHNKYVQSIYDLVAPSYATGGSFFDAVASHLVDTAAVPSGRVLDVGCGRGAVSKRLEADRPDLCVHSMDLSLEMLRANKAAASGEWTRRMVNARGESLPFRDETFSSVLCSQALPFFADSAQGLHEFERITRPQGKVAVSTNGRADPRLRWYMELLRAVPAGRPLVVRPLADMDSLRSAFEDAAFQQVEVRTTRIRVVFASPADFWSFSMTTGLRAALEDFPPADLDRLRADVESGFECMNDGEDLCVYYTVYVAVGTVQ
jgi:ubiquinone/menaquinone biosynthesis C-methylase UbiE